MFFFEDALDVGGQPHFEICGDKIRPVESPIPYPTPTPPTFPHPKYPNPIQGKGEGCKGVVVCQVSKMVMKSSSSTFLSALLGVTVILCIVKEGHGLQCYGIHGGKVSCDPCHNRAENEACATGSYIDDGKVFEKGCFCIDGKDTDCLADSFKKRCWCSTNLCNKATPTKTQDLPTLLSATALIIITSTLF